MRFWMPVLVLALSACVTAQPEPGGPVGGSVDGPVDGVVCGGLQGAACGAGEFCAYKQTGFCGAADQTGICLPRPEACTMEYNPVCGCDNNTYSNACVAASAGVSVAHTGECL